MEVVFHRGRLPYYKIIPDCLSSTIGYLKLLESVAHFMLFQAVSFYFQLLRSSSIEDVFQGGHLPSSKFL
jgi:hypothetical protein